jgi:hypothetical protein
MRVTFEKPNHLGWGEPMNKLLKASSWAAAIATSFLFLGATNVHAQAPAARFAVPSQQTGNAAAANAKLLRQNFTRPVVQPRQTLNRINRGTNGQFPNMVQPGNITPGLNPYGMNPGMSQGGYPGMYSGTGQSMYPGYYGY